MMRITCLFILIFSGSLLTSVVSAQPPAVPDHTGILLLADNHTDNKNREPESGSLIIPGQSKEEGEKKCLNVCKEWGESCIVNPRTGASNCRRTCKNFGMECF